MRRQTSAATRGLPLFLVCTVIAIVIGFTIRDYFSSDRLRTWIDTAIAKQPKPIQIHYQDIHVRLANGSLPQLAIEMTKVEITPSPECQTQAPLKASRLRFPLRLRALLTGKIAFGLIRADDLDVDLDGLRTACGKTPGAVALLPKTEDVLKPSPKRRSTKPVWWTSDEFFRVRELLEGFEFGNARIWFENKTKSVYLERFRAALDANDVAMIFNGRVRIPRELTAGEQLPDLEMTAVVREAEARVRTEARLNEGRLSGEARLTPTDDHDVRIESRIQISSLPLSTAVPLMAKVAVIKRPMRPRFLWLNCQAEISGKFHGLLTENPLEIRNCEMLGKGTSIQVAQATHLANGNWKPFTAVVRSADVRQLLETFSIGGLDGIATDFGRLDGILNVTDRGLSLDGQLDGMQLLFSNRNHRALQAVRNVQAKVLLERSGRILGQIAQMEVEGGEFAGDLKFEFAKSADFGHVQLNLKKLRLSDTVENLMTGGETEGLSGQLTAEFANRRLANLRGDLWFRGFRSASWEIEDLKVTPSLTNDHDVSLKLRAASAALLPQSPLQAITKPVLFTRYAAGERLVLRDVVIDGAVPLTGGFQWSEMSANGLNGRMKVVSQGQWTRDARELTGSLRVDYPAVKKLSWALGGTLDMPVLTFDEGSASTAFFERIASDSVTDHDLGLTAQK